MGEKTLERAEYRIFCLAVTDAVRLAMAGQIEAGHACLAAGLEHARELAEGGTDWAGGLEEDYRIALHHYDDLVRQQRQSLYRDSLLRRVALRAGKAADPGVSAPRRFRTMMGQVRRFQLTPRHWLSPN